MIVANSAIRASLAIYHLIYPTRAGGIIVKYNNKNMMLMCFKYFMRSAKSNASECVKHLDNLMIIVVFEEIVRI